MVSSGTDSNKDVYPIRVDSSGRPLIGATLPIKGIVEELIENANLPAGSSFLNGATVPAGEIWKITVINYVFKGTPPTFVRVTAEGLATRMVYTDDKTPVSDQFYFWNGETYLQAGDRISLRVIGVTAGDSLSSYYAGVKYNVI